MTTRVPSELKARSVLDALQAGATRGLTFKELLEVTRLTPSQVRSGMDFLRESLAEWKGAGPVFSYSPRDRRYRTAYLPDVVEAYEIMRLQSEATRSYRLLTGTVIPHAKQSRTKQLRMLRRHLQVVVEDTKDILSPT